MKTLTSLLAVALLPLSLVACGGEEPGAAESDVIELAGSEILDDPAEHFKYGSIGTDYLGVPDTLFRAMPMICPDKWRAAARLPNADPSVEPYRTKPYEVFGMIYEGGNDMPVGFSSRTTSINLPIHGKISATFVGPTCSLCHTSMVREFEDATPQFLYGAPATRIDIAAFNSFLLGCIADRDKFKTFRVGKILRSRGDKVKQAAITKAIRFMARSNADKFNRVLAYSGPWGPGRDDAVGLSASFILGEQYIEEDLPAATDFPAIWNQQAREGLGLHWDGGTTDGPFVRNALIAHGAGAPADLLPFDSLAKIQEFIDTLPPPPYPYEIDEALAAEGKPIFAAECASCHAEGGAYYGQVMLLDEVGTDPNRVLAATEGAIRASNELGGRGWEVNGNIATGGYINAMLDGIWARAPYLHNGSVPSLRDLLAPEDERPSSFYLGYNVYDQQNVGFVSDVAPRPSDPSYSVLDTAHGGNGSGGHTYGTQLSAEEKDALIEYLKTL